MKKSPRKVSIQLANPVCLEQQMDAAALVRLTETEGAAIVDLNEGPSEIIVLGCQYDTKHERASEHLLRKCCRISERSTEVTIEGCMSGSACSNCRTTHSPNSTPSPIWQPMRVQPRTFVDILLSRLAVVHKCLLGPLPAWPELTLRIARADAYIDPKALYVRPAIGCLGSCTYCSIRRNHGGLQSCDLDCLTEAIQSHEREWTRLVVVGDDVGAWGREFGSSFPKLLQALSILTSGRSIHIENLNPRWAVEYQEDLLRLIPKSSVVSLVMPVQSASEAILRRMGRQYTFSAAATFIEELRDREPLLNIQTHIITGFPAETDEAHQANVKFVRSGLCDAVRVFRFDRREGTPAARMSGQIEVSVAKRRYRDLVRTHHCGQLHRVRHYFSSEAPSYQTQHHASLSAQDRMKIVKDILNNRSFDRVLDVGCGPGTYLPLLASLAKEVCAIDVSKAMIQQASQVHIPEETTIEFHVTDAVVFKPPRTEFDLIVSIGVMEYIDDVKAFLMNLRRLCRLGGTLLLSVPNRWSPGRVTDRIIMRPFEAICRMMDITVPDKIRHSKPMSYTRAGYISHNEFGRSELIKVLRLAGFETIKIQDYNRPHFESRPLASAVKFSRRVTLLGTGLIVEAQVSCGTCPQPRRV